MPAKVTYFYHPQAVFYHGVAMGMQLNIKSDEAYRMASQLAALTGESLTAAVTEALRERLERQNGEREARERDKAALRAHLMEIAADIRANMDDGVSSDHGWLYNDETGLPK